MYVHCAVFVYIFPSQVSNLLEPQSTTIKSCFPASSQICSYRLGDFIYFIFMKKSIKSDSSVWPNLSCQSQSQKCSLSDTVSRQLS